MSNFGFRTQFQRISRAKDEADCHRRGLSRGLFSLKIINRCFCPFSHSKILQGAPQFPPQLLPLKRPFWTSIVTASVITRGKTTNNSPSATQNIPQHRIPFLLHRRRSTTLQISKNHSGYSKSEALANKISDLRPVLPPERQHRNYSFTVLSIFRTSKKGKGVVLRPKRATNPQITFRLRYLIAYFEITSAVHRRYHPNGNIFRTATLSQCEDKYFRF